MTSYRRPLAECAAGAVVVVVDFPAAFFLAGGDGGAAVVVVVVDAVVAAAVVVLVVDGGSVDAVVVVGPGSGGGDPGAPLPAGAWAGSVTTRTRLFLLSAIHRSPVRSMFRSWIVSNCASRAGLGPGSPAIRGLWPWAFDCPLPAMVVITPARSIRRIRPPVSSATSTSPLPSTAIPRGPLRWAAVAGPPSPSELPGMGYWFDAAARSAAALSPATVAILPSGVTRRTRSFSLSEMYTVRSGVTQTPSGWWSWASVAKPPSPP